MFDDLIWFSNVEQIGRQEEEGRLACCWNSYSWIEARVKVMEMEENTPVTRGESNGSAYPNVYPSCSLDPFALALSLLLCNPSTINN